MREFPDGRPLRTALCRRTGAQYGQRIAGSADTSSEQAATTRVVIADDHPLFRAGVRERLEADAAIEVVGEASDGEEAYALTGSLRPDVVLLDIAMPGVNGIEATRRIKAS
jgi:PleD family two-component response regulator